MGNSELNSGPRGAAVTKARVEIMMGSDLLGDMGWIVACWTTVLTGLTALVAALVVSELSGKSQRRSRSKDVPKDGETGSMIHR